MINKYSYLLLFSLSLIFSPAWASDTTDVDLGIKWSCYNDDTEAGIPGCYPFVYETIDGSGEHFNWLCNVVAILNYCSPVINLGGIWLNNLLKDRWNNQITASVEKQLEALKSGEKEIRRFLAEVVMNFDNGINSDADSSTASMLVENLNEYKCQHCITEFVNIVSTEEAEQDGLYEQRNNLQRFRKFAKKISGYVRNNGTPCPLYEEFIPVAKHQKGIVGRLASACFCDWNHPSHITTLLYALTALLAPPVIAYGVSNDPYNRSGSFGGDMANISNLLTIVPVHVLIFIQNWFNCSHIESKKLAEEINKRIDEIAGIIEIAGQAIGKMDNNIAQAEARGFIKALFLIGWPDDLVSDFKTLASVKGSDFTTFVHELKNRFNSGHHQKKIPYMDKDIEAAFNYFDVPENQIECEIALPINGD